ncbi:MAG: sigma-70 family RNA polymerase sigma factor [Chitinivibrionales bacterium]|nr:sigma-70 family RNA polymerase sigma factor [Chitinivibrionales bacterium]
MYNNNEIDTKEDSALFDRWVKGDSKAFEIIYKKYRKRIFGFLIKMTNERGLAEDLLQETFFAALRNSHQFDRQRSLLSWFFGIAHKKTIDHFRHVKVENDHQVEARRSIGSKIDNPDIDTSNKHIRELLHNAVQTLDPLQREVFLLRELGGVAFKDIAQIMDCPINTALGRMRLALKNIRKELEKRGVHGV